MKKADILINIFVTVCLAGLAIFGISIAWAGWDNAHDSFDGTINIPEILVTMGLATIVVGIALSLTVVLWKK